MTPLQIMQMITLMLQFAENTGINLAKLQEARARAKHQGRELTDDELKMFADDAQDAIDRLLQD